MYCASAEARGAICRRNRHAARISSSLVLADTDLDSAPVKAGEILILIAATSAGEVDLVRGGGSRPRSITRLLGTFELATPDLA